MSDDPVRRLRVELVFPRFKLLSGAERAILGLAAALARAGHAPRIVCHQFDDSCRARLADDVELVVSGARLDWTSNRYVNAIFDYARTLELARLLDPRADLRVFFGPALLLAWRGMRSSRRAGIPSIYYCWEPPRVLYQDRDEVMRRLGVMRWPLSAALSLYRRLDRRMVAAVDAVVTSSPFAARRIERCYGRAASPITLGIDRERLDTAPRARRSRGPTLLTVNYLHPRKRVDLIVEALAELADRGGPTGTASRGAATTGGGAAAPHAAPPHAARLAAAPLLVIVGDGPERRRLQELAGQLGVAGSVEFAGFVADEQLPGYYKDAVCYVHATREESFGLSVIEAAYCGRPVVAVDEGGVRDTVVDGVTGYRVPATPRGIAAGIRKVLEAPDRGRGLGAAGRAMIGAQYRWSRGVEDLLGVARGIEGGWSGGA